MEKLKIDIEGMHCGACATGIQMLVSGLDGVQSVFVDYNGKKGDIEFDSAKINQDSIFEAIAELGFKARVAQA